MELIDHVIELKEMVSEIKAKAETTNEKIDSHIEWCAKRDAKVDVLEKEVNEAKGAIKAIKWMVPAVSAVVVGTIKMLTSSWK